MSVHYKFKSEKQFATVSFDGVHISVADLKKEISHQKNFGKCEFGLLIKNAQTDEEYNNDNALIAKNTSVIVSRVPLTVQQKRSWDRNESQQFVHSRDEASTSHPVDLSRIDGSENDKINAMMTQSSHDYNPSNYQKLRGGNQTGEVPPSYRCHKCHQQGHWIKNCPLTLNQESIEIKKSTGIPRSFMIPVEGPRAPGAMITPTGHYAVPAIDHQAYKEGKKERPPFSSDPEPIIKKPEIPDDLTCNYCKDLLTDAVLIPCCAGAFCDLCIRTHLVESETNECPVCNEKEISPGGLIPSRFLRNSVMRFINETGYARRQIYPPSKKNKDESIDIENTVEPTFAVPQVPNEVVDIDAAVKAEETIPKTIPTTVEDEAKLVDPVIPIEASEPVQAVIEEGHEVIIPPGTEEPLLPITKVTSEKEINNSDTITTKKDDYEETFEDDRKPRERPRVFNKDPQRDRGSERIVGTYRLINRRRSSSPRQRNDYPNQHGHMHMMNQTKEYQNMPPANSQRYPPNMHYEQDMRRPGERPGTPTIDEPHLHQQNQGNPPNMMPYPPGEERISQQQQQQQHQQQQPQPQQQQQQQGGYNQPPPSMPPHGNPLLPDPYGMNHGHRMPMYPHQPGPHYGPPRYDRPPYQQPGYRPSQPRGGYNGPPRPMRGMHHPGYRGIQPPPIGIPRNIHNGNPTGVIDDPLEAFERMLREKDERDRRLGKHRRRSRTRSRSRSYSRSRSRSFGRRSPRLSRSRSPPPKRRGSRSPLPSRRSRSPKRRSRDGSRSFSISRSRSYSRSQSPPRGAISRDRDRERERDRDRDLPPRYRSPVRSPPRFQRDRERERDRPRSREGYSTNYYSESKDYGYRDRDRERERERDSTSTRERTGSRYSRNQTSQHSTIPSLMSSHPPPPLMSLGSQSTPTTTTTTTSPSTQLPSASSSSSTAPLPSTAVAATSVVPAAPERKDYYDSYNRYSGPPGQQQRFNSPTRGDYQKRFDDVAPPGTEGYYDVPPPGVDHPERLLRDERERPRSVQDDRDHKDADDDRPSRDDRPRDTRDREDRDRRDRDREREKDDRPLHQKEKDERDRRDVKDKEHDRYVRRDDDRTRDYDKDKDKYRDDRERGERDRYRNDDKIRIRERTDRKDRDFDDKERDRHDRHSDDRKKNKKSSSPHPQKTRSDTRDISPEKKKEKKLKDKKKKKDSVDEKLEKKKKKKKEKKSLKEAIAKNELSKYQSLQSSDNNTLSDKNDDKLLLSSLNDIKHENNDDKMNTGDVSTSHDESFDIGDQNNSLVESTIKNNDKTIISMMNPEPPEQTDDNNDDFCLNPPNPNFKPIPEVKNNTDKPTIDSLYEGLDDTEINTVITEKYAILPEEELTNVEKYNSNDDATKRIDDEDDEDDNDNDDGDDDDVVEGKSINTSAAIATTTIEPLTSTPTRITTSTPERNIATATATSIKTTTKDEFLAPMPELSKWERDERDEPDEPESDTAEEFIKLDVSITSPQHSDIINDELQSTKLVTSEVLKRAENAIFQKAINAIRPIEIKKISESRKVLYQNPEPKNIIDTNTDLNRSSSDRKSVNVTINVGKNERNVEITEPSLKKSKLDRSNYRSNNDLLLHSPTRLSAKERLGDKIDDDDGNKDDSKTLFYDKDINKSDNNLIGRSRSPKLNRKQSPIIDTISRHTTSERKVYLDDKKRDKNERQRDHRGHHSIDIKNDIKDTFIKREKNDNKDDSRSIKNTDKIDKEKRGKSPVYAKHNTVKRKIVGGGVGDDDDIDKKKDSKKNREDKKRKRSHRSNSRSKSKDCKRKKEKKHKDNKKQKHNKEHSSSVLREKLITNEKSTIEEKNKVQEDNNDDNIVGKKLNRKNPRLISDRKKSALDEASFEPDYSASETATDDNNDDNLMNIKKQKNNDDLIATDSVKDKIIDSKIINKKRIKSTSSDDDDEDSSTTLSSSSESDDSSYKKRKKKHKKHKKRKTTRKDSSSDSDSYSDSSESSSEDEKHKKKSKKSKSKSKQSKKKKKSKHK